MRKYLIFDMDGVLINTEPLHYKIWKQVFREKGLEIDYEHYKGCIGSTNQTLFRLIEEGYGVRFHEDESVLERFKELKNLYIHKNGIPAVEGVPKVIAKLKEKGYHMAVASSSMQEYIEICTEKIGVKQYFDILFSAERVARPKPFPDVFLSVAKQMGARPEECIVVEDSYNGSIAAKAAGMICLGFANPDSGEQDLSMDDLVFYPFTELIEAVEKEY